MQDNNENNNNDGIFISYKKIILVIASFIVSVIIIFMAGYFLGQRYGINHFLNKTNSDTFADRINYSLYTMYDKDINDTDSDNDTDDDSLNEDDTSDNNDDNNDDEESTNTQSINNDSTKLENNVINNTINEEKSSIVPSQDESKKDFIDTAITGESTLYIAQLIGFGTIASAREFVQRIAPLDVAVEIKKRVSKNKKGRQIAWYQVVTEPCHDRDSLQQVVNRIKHKEHIKDVSIIQVKKGV